MTTLMGLLVGDVEVEERRPRSWNESRRKRLSFVRDSRSRSRRRSPEDEWALVPRQQNSQPHRRQNSQELWDLQKWEAEQRFLALEHQRLQQRAHRLQLEQQRYMPAHPPPRQQIQGGFHDERGRPPIPPEHMGGGEHGADLRGHNEQHDRYAQGGHDPRIQQIQPRGGGRFDEHDDYEDDDDDSGSRAIIEILDNGSHHGGRSPKRIDRVHDVPYRSPGRSKSRGRTGKKSLPKDKKKKSKSKSKKRSKSVYSDSSSSSESDKEFVQGFRAGIRAVSRKPAGRGRSSSRVHERHYSDPEDSFDDLRYYERPRLRSKSRASGRRLWGM